MPSILTRLQQWWEARRARRISYEYAQTRVQRGAAYLDEVDPGWYRRVDPDTLEMSSGASCVLGQLHGTFRIGLSRSQLVDLSSAPRVSLSPVSYGFHCVDGVSEAAQERDYAYLNRAWREAVRTRHAADGNEPSREDSQGDRPAVPSDSSASAATPQPV